MLFLLSDIQTVHRCIRQGGLAKSALDAEQGGSLVVLNLGMQAGDEYCSDK
jgi:hypothetical protein